MDCRPYLCRKLKRMSKEKQTTYFLVTLSKDTLYRIEKVKTHMRVLAFYALPDHKKKRMKKRLSLPVVTNSEVVEAMLNPAHEIHIIPNLYTREDVYPVEGETK